MKKMMFGALLLAGALVSAQAWEVRLGVASAAGFGQQPSAGQVVDSFSSGSQVFTGPTFEFVFDKLGVGSFSLCQFDDATGPWLINFDHNLFVSYHLLGDLSALDPWGSVGLASFGQVDASRGAQMGPNNLEGLTLSLSPRLTAGVNVKLDGLLLGLSAQYTPYNWRVPASPILRAQGTNFQIGLSAAYALGSWMCQ